MTHARIPEVQQRCSPTCSQEKLSGGICGGVFAAASAARSETVGRRMAHDAAAAELEWWLCRHCRDAVNHNSATTCSRCGSSVREMTPYASPAEVAALSTNAQRTAYGRRLKSVQGKEQPVALAVAQTPGSAGYASAVLAQIASFQPGSKRLEAMVEPRVCLFDGWLALTTDGTVRFWTRDDVRAFFACGEGEALIAEYILSWGRRVDIGVEGQPLLVQAAPKGGWWMRALFTRARDVQTGLPGESEWRGSRLAQQRERCALHGGT